VSWTPSGMGMSSKPCKDCVTDWADEERLHLRPVPEDVRAAFLAAVPPSRRRPAPHPGPRCTTHHREVTRARKASRHAKYVGRTYGLGDGEYEALHEAQEGLCYICKRAKGTTRKLSVDHDHKCCDGPVSCGECVRGLLCRPCNDMLGHARDDWRMFARAIQYLLSPPARAILERIRGK